MRSALCIYKNAKNWITGTSYYTKDNHLLDILVNQRQTAAWHSGRSQNNSLSATLTSAKLQKGLAKFADLRVCLCKTVSLQMPSIRSPSHFATCVPTSVLAKCNSRDKVEWTLLECRAMEKRSLSNGACMQRCDARCKGLGFQGFGSLGGLVSGGGSSDDLVSKGSEVQGGLTSRRSEVQGI